MLEERYKILKSGTDIRGVAIPDIKEDIVNLTVDIVKNIGYGFLTWLSKKTCKEAKELTISIGRDVRVSGPKIMSLLVDEMIKYGVKIFNCGLSSTPAMFMTTIDLKVDGAIEITASHHPFNRNGIKFFTCDGGLNGSDILEILQYAQDNDAPQKCEGGIVEDIEYMDTYAKHIREIIKNGIDPNNELPLKGFHIVVDAGNGVGGFYESKVLKPLGADTSGSRFLEPDGMFPNHTPNPEDKKAMASICEAVIKNNADLGVIFDTDVDRGGAVDSTGKEINRNRLIALASIIALKGNDGGTIVTDSITSTGLKEFIEDYLGGKHFRYVRGYKNLINKVEQLNSEGINAPLAAETSGHVAMRENYFLDDGAYLCTKIIIEMVNLKKKGKSISELLAPLKEPVESEEIRIKIIDKDFKETGNRILKELEDYADSIDSWHVFDDSFEGVRVSFDKQNGDGWFLLRLSVHDPILPLNIESDSKGGVEIIRKKVFSFLENQNGIEY